ncbi:MAG TPA: penicillin-binding protein, partial [Eubacteriaceae bacterium]|nr:penicillin-binding protein [Eubacteriaceae bacterium]
MKNFLLILMILVLVAVSAGIFFVLSVEGVDVQNYEYTPYEKSTVYSDDGYSLGEIYEENRTYVPLAQIPEPLIKGIVAVEDSRFYEHRGFDPIGILRATKANVQTGEIEEGASTITQQLARNLFEDITTEQTVLRKIKEIKTAIQLENKYTKEKILEMYLNEIYLGGGSYGVQEASHRFFGKDVWELNLAESALLAGLPQAPSAYQPDVHFDRAQKRQHWVLDRMQTEGYITVEEATQAKEEPIEIAESKKDDIIGTYKKGYEKVIRRAIEEYVAIYKEEHHIVSDADAREQAQRSLKRDGLSLYVTVHTKMQEEAKMQIEQAVANRNLPEATGALVTMDSTSGRILAYYGGNTEVDMASRPRQPGSAIKPLIYSGALEAEAIEQSTILEDREKDFNGFKPNNYGDRYYGHVTVREALVQSLNVPAVEVMQRYGIDNTMDHLENMGISTLTENDYYLPTAIGGMSQGITPFEMTKAFSVFSSGGNLVEPYLIEVVLDKEEETIYSRVEELAVKEPRRILSATTAEYMDDVLTDAVKRGTGQNARGRYQTAGKTGTSSDSRDLWFAGYTGPYVT